MPITQKRRRFIMTTEATKTRRKKSATGQGTAAASEEAVARPALPIEVFIGRLPGRLNKYTIPYGTTLGEALETAREYDDKIPEIDLGRGDKFEMRYNASIINQDGGIDQVLEPMDTIMILKYIKGN